MKNIKNKIMLSVVALAALGSSTANAWNFRMPTSNNEKAGVVAAVVVGTAAGYYGVKALWSWMSTPKVAPVAIQGSTFEDVSQAVEKGSAVVSSSPQTDGTSKKASQTVLTSKDASLFTQVKDIPTNALPSSVSKLIRKVERVKDLPTKVMLLQEILKRVNTNSGLGTEEAIVRGIRAIVKSASK